LAAADELAAFSDANAMLRRAVELARDAIGFDRVSIYICDPRADAPLLRGTWGTALSGQMTDEHTVSHDCSRRDVETLERLHGDGRLWQYEDGVPLYADGPGGARLGRRWLAVTPLVAARKLVGVMYNDGARTNTALDEGKQTHAAIFCSALAGLLSSRSVSLQWPEATKSPSARIAHVLRRVQEDARVSGGELARELGISPGYLARSFHAEMGLSLVEYRNRQMLERFFEMVRQGESKLLTAALEAGFSSYTHFSRVHRKLMGSTATDRLAQLEAADRRPRYVDGR
jgi:AraC-like DNA-binding protein